MEWGWMEIFGNFLNNLSFDIGFGQRDKGIEKSIYQSAPSVQSCELVFYYYMYQKLHQLALYST